MTDVNAVGERIRTFVLEKFPLARRHGLKNGDQLLESGIVDSLGVLDMVGFLEGEFAIHITDEELLPENFQSIERLAQFVRRKTNAGSGSARPPQG